MQCCPMQAYAHAGIRCVPVQHLPAPHRIPTHQPTRPRAPPMQNGASKQRGEVLVQEHVPKVKDFFAKPCWAHHPKPYSDFVAFKQQEQAELEAERKKMVRV